MSFLDKIGLSRLWTNILILVDTTAQTVSNNTITSAKEYTNTMIKDTLNVTDGIGYIDAGVITQEGVDVNG